MTGRSRVARGKASKMHRPTRFTKPIYADSHEWKCGVLLIAAIVGVPLALVALVRLLAG
jgi:hypothetical protein